MAVTRYFEARNNDRVCIIDDNFKNLGLKELISLDNYTIRDEWQLASYDESALNTVFTGSSYMMVNIKPFNSENLLAISCDVSDLAYSTYVHDDILSIYVMKDGAGDYHNANDAAYAIAHTRVLHYATTENFDVPESYGLHIFNEKGKRIFNSSYRYLKVIDTATQDIDDVSDIDRTYNYNIAIVPLSCRFTVSYNPQIINYYRHFFTIFDSVRLRMVPRLLYAIHPAGYHPLTGYFYNTNLLVIMNDI